MMDRAYTKTTTVRPHFLPTMLVRHNIQSSSSRKNIYSIRNHNKSWLLL